MAKGKKVVEEPKKEAKKLVIDHFLTVKDIAECPATHDEYEVTEEMLAEIPQLAELGLKVGDKFFYPKGK